MNKDGDYVSDDKEMAETLSSQYSSVFSTPKQKLPDSNTLFHQDISDNMSLCNFEFNVKDIEEAIDEISLTAAAGPDGFPAILLKTCKTTLSKPLYILWRKSLDIGITPDLLKRSHIIPMHKGGSHALPANYRPVALTSHIIKLFEKIIRKNLANFLEENGLFNNTQHGFRNGTIMS